MVTYCDGLSLPSSRRILKQRAGGFHEWHLLGTPWSETDKIINEEIGKIAEEKGTSMSMVATAWVLSKPFVTAPIIGISKIERVKEACDAIDFELTKEDIERIDRLYQPKQTIGFK